MKIRGNRQLISDWLNSYKFDLISCSDYPARLDLLKFYHLRAKNKIQCFFITGGLSNLSEMKKIKFISCIFFLLYVSINLQAQYTVSGYIQDSATSYPLFDARVTIFNSDTSFFREARGDGPFYSFQDITPGNYFIGASVTGKDYRQRAITISGDSSNNNFILPDESQEGRWDVIVQSPEALGGTDLAILLPNGKIYYCHSSKDPFVFDPTINDTMSVAGDSVVQGCAAPLLLPNGKVIFVGGTDQEIYGPGTRKVKTYDYVTDTWEHLPNMLDYRWYPTMTRLTDGKLLIIGGGGLNNPVRTNSSEIYDPSTGVSYFVDTVQIKNELSPILMLYNGNVLMTHRPPQLFDASTEQWNACADFQQGNRMPNGDHADHELVLLPEGNVVAVGYKSFTGTVGQFVEVYDPSADSWSVGANFSPVRSRPKTVLLPDKKILVMAGYKEESTDPTAVNTWGYMKLTDLYNPYQDSWRRLADMNYFREYHSLPVLVPDGRIIIVGGEGQPGNEPSFSVIEAFTPPYLFRGVRPKIENLAQTTFSRGSRISFDVTKTDSITSVILMSTPSISHFMNCGNNRFVELEFAQSNNSVTATIPLDSLQVLDGYYQLFAMVDDIPSKAEIIKVEGRNFAPVLNCDSFCVVSIVYDTVSPNNLYVTIANNDTNFINYPIVQLIDGNGDTVANQQKEFDFYGQLPATQQTYHIPTLLDSFPSNWTGQVRLEDGLFHTACIIDFPCAGIPNALPDLDYNPDFTIISYIGNDKITIRINGTISGEADILVSNSLGQIVHTEKLSSAICSIPINTWPNGVYLIWVDISGRKLGKKFIVSHYP